MSQDPDGTDDSHNRDAEPPDRATTAPDRDAEAPKRDDAPLAGLRADIEERRQRRQSSTQDVDEVFEEAGSEPVVDGEQVWEDLLAGQDGEAGVLAFGEPVDGESADVTVIPSRVCHSCTHFGDPPELHCTHDGTTIRCMVDMDHYEVVDCPVVKNRSDLQG